ncbi:MAG: hypothetical protein FIB01_03730, partial [Gemmatimonadetes bacterium]|nr:hypothetical protein [Gemmatimonadota bacterium]
MKTAAIVLVALAGTAAGAAGRAQTGDTLPECWTRAGPAFGTSAYRVELDRSSPHGGQASLRISSERADPGEWAGATQLFRADDLRGR